MTPPVPSRETSVAEATQRGISGLISDANERFQHLDQTLEDLRDLTLAASRIALGERASVPFDELLKAYGLTYADLAALPDDQTLAADGE